MLKIKIINNGSKDNIKIGTNIYDQSYVVGRVIEVNYTSSRVLLLSDLNSNVPVTIAPQNIQAIITGYGNNYGQIKYIKDGLKEKLTEESIVYTSGTGALFISGIPIGKLKKIDTESKATFHVDFFSDFSQLKYVFAEIITKTNIEKLNSSENKKPIDAKIRILEDEIEIIEDSNTKFIEENEDLKNQINLLKDKVINFQTEISLQKQKINQIIIDKDELEFLRLNLEYGHKCRKSFFNKKGYVAGTLKYKNCVLNKGRKN